MWKQRAQYSRRFSWSQENRWSWSHHEPQKRLWTVKICMLSDRSEWRSKKRGHCIRTDIFCNPDIHTGRKLLTTLMNWTKITEDLLSGETSNSGIKCWQRQHIMQELLRMRNLRFFKMPDIWWIRCWRYFGSSLSECVWWRCISVIMRKK